MPRRKKNQESSELPPLMPSLSPEARENQLISMAMNQAEKMLAEGNAPAQVVTHFLKLASTRERLEKEILEKQNELLVAKTQAIKSQQNSEKLYEKAIAAMRAYSGNGVFDD